jgi:hypothetical protein
VEYGSVSASNDAEAKYITAQRLFFRYRDRAAGEQPIRIDWWTEESGSALTRIDDL